LENKKKEPEVKAEELPPDDVTFMKNIQINNLVNKSAIQSFGKYLTKKQKSFSHIDSALSKLILAQKTEALNAEDPELVSLQKNKSEK